MSGAFVIEAEAYVPGAPKKYTYCLGSRCTGYEVLVGVHQCAYCDRRFEVPTGGMMPKHRPSRAPLEDPSSQA